MMGEHARLLFHSHKNFKQVPNEHDRSYGSHNNSGNLHICPPLTYQDPLFKPKPYCSLLIGFPFRHSRTKRRHVGIGFLTKDFSAATLTFGDYAVRRWLTEFIKNGGRDDLVEKR